MPTVRNVVTDIKSKLLHPALTSHFEVTIPKLGKKFDDFLRYNDVVLNQDKLNLMCSEATLPGSNLATFEINDNFHGVTERHAYRRVYDDRIDLTFYVNADEVGSYLPIRYFETWMKWIVDESMGDSDKGPGVNSNSRNYFYRVRYPEGDGNGKFPGYTADGLTVTKFERTGNVSYDGSKMKGDKYTGPTLEYKFIRSFPISINSMPVSYDSSSLLKCTVSMSYIRYVLVQGSAKASPQSDTQSNFNLTPQQLANINNIAFNPNTNLGIPPLTTGGVSRPSAQASGNNVNLAFSGVSLL